MSEPTRTDHAAPSDRSPSDPHSTASIGAGAPPLVSPLPPPGERYTLGDEIARGGMGVVYRATDTVLHRDVAVKVLHEKFGPHSGAARRFADEARITGQLQHPGIPPVHDLGTLPDGRPFLAMKLIKGQTLDKLLDERAEPSSDRGRFVAAFEQICQAVAYAHAHRVIHRDLKPANVMVGDYGEVQVMDWGLAKVLGRERERDDEPEMTAATTDIRTLRDSDGGYTHSGSILGTPAYMAPEQAIGAIEQIDVRSDVFGLGGIFAVLLTGRPPFQGDSAESTRQASALGKVQDCFERLDSSGADAELVALCKRCLNPEKTARPADAGELAKAVAGWRAASEERARRAELERTRADVQAAEQRKRRRALLVAASALIIVLTGGMAGTFVGWVRAENAVAAEAEQRGKAEKARDDLTVALKSEEKARIDLSAALMTAQSAQAEAEENFQLAREAVFNVGWDIPEILREAQYARSAQNKIADLLAKTMEKQLALSRTRNLPDRALHAATLKLGDLRYAQGQWNDAQKKYDEALAISERVLATEEREKDRAKSNVAWTHYRLGLLALDGRDNMSLALEQFRTAETLYREILTSPTTGEIPPGEVQAQLATVLHSIADVYDRKQEYDVALLVCREAVRLREEAAVAMRVLDFWSLAGRWSNLRAAPRQLADSLVLYAEIQFKRGENVDAERAMTTATRIYDEEITRDPTNLNARRSAATANRSAGDFLLFLNRYDDAKQYHNHDIELCQSLLRIPEIVSAENDLSRAHYRSGTLALKRGDRATALDHYRRCVAIREEVVAAQDWNDYAKLGLAGARARSGDYSGSVQVLDPMIRRFPRNLGVVSESAATLGLCADAVRAGRPLEELNMFELARYELLRTHALNNIERMTTQWDWMDLVRLQTDPDFDPIRDDPRFAEAIKRTEERIAAKKPQPAPPPREVMR